MSNSINNNHIALSFDVEDWYHAAPVTGSSFSIYKSLDDFFFDKEVSKQDCITNETIRIIKILDELNIRATFFIVADVAKRYPLITKALKNSQHEIASHSLNHHSAIDAKTKADLQTRDKWYEEQKEAKKALENIFDKEVIGWRAPNAYFANWMVPLLVKLGFKYDSSIAYNSFYNKTNVKLKDIPSRPYWLNSENLSHVNPDSKLLELPWSNYKINNRLILPAGGGFFFRLAGYRFFKKVLNRSLKNGDSMFYLHPLDISEKKIPLENKLSRPLLWMNKGKTTEKKLVKLLNNYKGILKPCSDIYYKYKEES